MTGTLIEQAIIGSAASTFSDPGVGVRSGSKNVLSLGADAGTLRNNLIGFAADTGFSSRWGSAGWTIQNNEFRSNSSYGHDVDDGIAVEQAGSGSAIITGNLIIANGAHGIDLFEGDGSNVITENTMQANGFGTGAGATETAGMSPVGTSNTVRHNLIEGNYGAGVLVTSGSAANLISQIPTASTVPNGVEFRFLLYINNRNGARTDVSVRDVLDPAFVYQPGTTRMDNAVAGCAAVTCTLGEEAAIFAAVTAAPLLTDAVDGDTVSFTGGNTIDAGNQNEVNAQLNIAGSRVWAIVFAVKMQ